MEKEDKIEDFAWVLLEGDVWWPSIVKNPTNKYLNRKRQSNCRIVQLLGTNETIAVKNNLQEQEIILLSSFSSSSQTIDFLDLHRVQEIPAELKEFFEMALVSLNELVTQNFEGKETERKESNVDLNETNSEIVVSPPSNQQLSTKRKDALTWDDYFIAVAFLSAMRSKDPSTQVGACIVNKKLRIVGIGYNGFPRGCSDDILPWARVADNELDTKYPVSFFLLFLCFLCFFVL